MDNGKKLELLKDKVKDLSMIGEESFLVDADLIIDLIDESFNQEAIPDFVADWIDVVKGIDGDYIGALCDGRYNWWVEDWLFYRSEEESVRNRKSLLRAISNGYKREKCRKLYARIKGHELVETEPIIEDGRDISEWSRNIYFVLQKDGQVIVDMKDSGLSGAKHIMTMAQWNMLGINDGNADFEEVQQ